MNWDSQYSRVTYRRNSPLRCAHEGDLRTASGSEGGQRNSLEGEGPKQRKKKTCFGGEGERKNIGSLVGLPRRTWEEKDFG